jgi:hypothetical protein
MILDDAEFLNAEPPLVQASSDPVTPVVTEPVVIEPAVVTTTVETPAVVDEVVVENPVTDPVVDLEDKTKPPVVTEPVIALPGESNNEPVVVEEVKKVVPAAEAVDYQSFYKDLMAPLKANGKDIEIRSKEDILQLMRMGANYTRKMQDIAPHRKILAMLENNGMLDESKLSYYIDLDKKNPEAIKKLIKESGIDPLDIDLKAESTYQQGNHQVGDDEVAFRSALEDVKSTPTGQETLQIINTTWDKTSKEELWKSPEVLSIIHQQRENGIYDRVATEVQRQTMLGAIPAGTPFVQAYMKVGNELGAQGAFADLAPLQVAQPSQNAGVRPAAQVNVPVATRVVAPKPQVTNSAAANAAAASRGNPKRIAPIANLQGMGDEDFMKNWANRL